MNSGAILYTFAAGACAGIAAALFGLAGVDIALAALAVALAALAASFFALRRTCLFAAILLAALSLGILRAHAVAGNFAAQNLLSFANDGTRTVAGVIAADPDVRDDTTHVDVDVSLVDGVLARGKLVAYLPPGAPLAYGDLVVLRGGLEAPQPFMGDNGNEFDYPKYLAVRGVSAVLSSASVASSRSGGLSFFGALYRLRERFDASIVAQFPEPESPLLQGMLFGERRGLPDALQRILVDVGLIHIVILAGYALSLVAQAVGSAADVLPRRYRLAAVALVLVAYVIMTGAAASTTRAAIMAIIAMVARLNGRTSAAMRSLACAVVLMALWNPPILVWDTGFIVSALATFGLVTLGESTAHMLWFIPERLKLREIAASTLTVQIFALPALLYYTGNLSLVALPANVLALPALPYAMLFGFLAAALGLLHPMFAFIPKLIAFALVHYLLFIAQTAARVPYGFSTAYAFPGWGAVLIYIPLTLLAINEYIHRLKETKLAASGEAAS